MSIRPATPEDAAVLAELMNAAGEGLPAFLWSRMAGPDEDVMAVGARRVARDEGGFSYTHAHVAEESGAVAGMLVGYRLPDPYAIGDLEAYPEVVRPLVELEAQAPGAWYVNAIATGQAHRGRGIGTRLMRLAESLAREAGAESMSLIVAEGNAGAKRLYENLGYRVVARRPIAPFPGCPHDGDWILMTKPVAADTVPGP
jgi:ribosomal protein S18 acetylase RimI-like enzyme